MNHLRIFYDVDAGGAVGSSVEAPAAGDVPAAGADAGVPTDPVANAPEAGAAAQGAATPFLTYGDRQFASQDELISFLDRETLAKSGYDNKARELADRQRQFEESQRNQQGDFQSARERAEKFDRLQKMLAANPQAYQWLQQQLGQAPTAEGIAHQTDHSMRSAIEQAKAELRQEYQPALDHYQTTQQEQQLQSNVEQAAKQFGQGFPTDRVTAMLKSVAEVPPEQRMSFLALAMGRAFTGQQGAAIIQGQAGAAPPGTARPGIGGAVAAPTAPDQAGGTAEDLAAQAREDIRTGRFKLPPA